MSEEELRVARRAVHDIEHDPSEVYGGGFRRALHCWRSIGLHETLAFPRACRPPRASTWFTAISVVPIKARTPGDIPRREARPRRRSLSRRSRPRHSRVARTARRGFGAWAARSRTAPPDS
eukprot:scaffold1953_cov391-Prasinococcus_capsulatus_cf.AAC.3